MLDRITSGADKVIFTRVNNIRTADPHELAARYVELYGKMAQVAGSLPEGGGASAYSPQAARIRASIRSGELIPQILISGI